MNELRWILIGFGIVLLAGIYLWGRRAGAVVTEDGVLRGRPEPALQTHGFADAHREPEPVVAEEPAVNYETTAVRPAPARPEKRNFRAEAPVAESDEPPPPSFTRELPRSFSKEPPAAEPARPNPLPDFRRGRLEPTLGHDEVTQEMQTQPMSAASSAPTLSSSETSGLRRADNRRKILSLRLSLAPQRVEGAKLQEVLQGELMEHGKYDIFHRLHADGQSVFSIASMVEPGTFDLEKMSETLYTGVTLFAQLPGPVPGMHALNELVACARRLHTGLGGVLQDDRGVPLTVHRIERMRQEVREFERPASSAARTPRGEGYQE
jgi:cell division protein ZipA